MNAIAKEGCHRFEIGEKIKFIEAVEDMVYSKGFEIYNFVNKQGVSQHLEGKEFEWIK